MTKGIQQPLRCPACKKVDSCELTGALRLGARCNPTNRRQVQVQCACGRKWWTRDREAMRAAKGLWEQMERLKQAGL